MAAVRSGTTLKDAAAHTREAQHLAPHQFTVEQVRYIPGEHGMQDVIHARFTR